MKIVHLCARSIARLCRLGWHDTWRYRYEYVGFTHSIESGQQYVTAKRYRLIDIARRDYDTFEVVKIYW